MRFAPWILFSAFLLAGGLSVGTAQAEAGVEPTLAGVLVRAEAAEQSFDTRAALTLYVEADALQPDNSVILQKIAQQYSDLTLEAATYPEKKAKAEQALVYAKRAVALAPDNAVNVLSLAICYGKLGSYSDTRTKIDYSRQVRIEAERAVALDPNYDWARHVLGRWHYEVATLGAPTRLVVRMIYGGLPGASLETAIRELEMAVALAPTRIPHHLELGFAYLAANRKADAAASFERGLALPSVERYDETAKTRARAALKKL